MASCRTYYAQGPSQILVGESFTINLINMYQLIESYCSKKKLMGYLVKKKYYSFNILQKIRIEGLYESNK